MDRLVLVGGGGHAQVVSNVLKKLGQFTILGYVAHSPSTGFFCEYLGTDQWLEDGISRYPGCKAVIAVGVTTIQSVRQSIAERLLFLGYESPALVSPHAIVAESCTIGPGTVVMDGAVIQPNTVIGRHVIINTGAIIEHDCTVGDFVHVGPGSVLCGGVFVGSESVVGAGVTVIQSKKIQNKSLIGAGSVVVEDCLIEGLYLGVPAKRVVLGGEC